MDEQPDFNFKMGILENGLDFILDAVDHFEKNSNHRDIKYGLLHLAAGVELILKAPLWKYDWKLVFSKPKHANINSLTTGDFHSVGLTECIKRLEEEGLYEFSEDQIIVLNALKFKRNRMEHFDIVDLTDAIISSSSKVT